MPYWPSFPFFERNAVLISSRLSHEIAVFHSYLQLTNIMCIVHVTIQVTIICRSPFITVHIFSEIGSHGGPPEGA